MNDSISNDTSNIEAEIKQESLENQQEKSLTNSKLKKKKKAFKTRKRRYQFTNHKAQRNKLKFKSRFTPSPSKSSPENLNDYLIQGRNVKLNKVDFERFVQNNKWKASEFFRFKQVDLEEKCIFCSFKCKSQTEGYFVCSHCRYFGQKSLVKHHMFVCKNREKPEKDYCKFKRSNDTSMQSETMYCRFCHFKLIVNSLPSLKRLQENLVQFINNRVIYVNSVSKKTMLWRSRLNFSPVKESKLDISQATPVDKEKENSERRGPRVKHVSRAQPVYLNPVDNLLKQKKPNFYTELNNINLDLEPVFINWQSFTSDLKTQFTLSALPDKFKSNMVKRNSCEFSFNFEAKNLNQNKSLSDDLISNEFTYKNDNFPTTDESSNLSSSATQVLKNSTKNMAKSKAISFKKHSQPYKEECSTIKTFDWDDYFEKNHKISSNQNFRFSSLGQSNLKDSYTPKNISCLSVKSTETLELTNQESNSNTYSSKRFTSKLNSYKDKFQPYLLESINERIKDSSKSSEILNDKNNNSFSNNNKNFFINTTDLINSVCSSASNSNNANTCTNSNLNSSNLVQYPFVIPDYLVWDNNIVNKINDLYKNGLSVISYYPYSLKSLCYLCGSAPEQDNQLNYCGICCEPYHNFCLKESERPKENCLLIDWVCPACKYCEICFQQNDLQTCFKCNDCFHFDCLKKSSYPRKVCKKSKKWICLKCFECKICKSKNIFYDKKTFNKITNFNFNSCFKCYEKYQLDKPFKCCNLSLADSNENLNECEKCLLLTHPTCLNLTNEDLDILKLNNLKFECKICLESLENLRLHLDEFKLKIFQDLFNGPEFEDKIVEFLENSKFCSQIELSKLINDFYEILKSDLKNQETIILIKTKLIEIIKQKYSFLLDYLTKYGDLMEIEKNSIEETKDEPKEKSDKNNKNIEFFEELVKCPHEDHTYAISSNSIVLALQSSQILDQNNPKSVLEQIKDIQMNSTLQKILNSKFQINQEEKKSKLSTIDFNDLKEVKHFCNSKTNSADFRECVACRLIGDDDICGRLLPFDGYWIHMNCLLWSDDVYIEGNLVEQILSIFQKTKMICCYCKRDGATISCYNKVCNQTYHFNCAYESKCFISDDLSNVLLEKLDKKQKTNGYFLYCPEHSVDMKLLDLEEIKNMKVNKNLLIDVRDDNFRRKYSFPKFSLKPPTSNPFILIGSLQVEALGDLETISDYKDFLCPIGFTCSRLFWSTNEIGKKVVYKCRIRHIDEYKNELETLKREEENEKKKNVSIDSAEFKFYLDNFYEKEESLANLNTDLDRLNSINQVDGLNDSLFNSESNQVQNKNVIKFPTGVTVVQKFTQMGANQLNIVNRPLITNIPSQKTFCQLPTLNSTPNPTEKPKVLKLESNLKSFSNIKTSFVRVDRPIINTNTNGINFSNSDFYMNKNFLLNTRQNENTISPRSDRSDSSLNLNHCSSIINPMQSSFEDLVSQSSSQSFSIPPTILENTNLSLPISKPEKKIKEPKFSKDKKKEKAEKKPKKIKGDSLSTKCTVAALLNAFHKEKQEKLPEAPLEPQPCLFQPLQPLPPLILPQEAKPEPLNFFPSELPMNLIQQASSQIQKPTTQRKKLVSQKVKNKLRDYFRDELLETQDIIENTILVNNQEPIKEPNESAKIETSSLLKSLEAKILERKYKKKEKEKELKGVKTKSKFNSGIEKKKAKLSKEANLTSNKAAKGGDRCIVNNMYNDLDLENPNSQTNRGQLVFEITCEDGLKVISYDINKAWRVIIEKIKKMRQEYKLKTMSTKVLNGVRMFGLNHRSVIYMLEQLDSIEFCPLYKTKFIHKNNLNDKWIINLNNCARTIKQFDGNKKCLDPFYWLASEHRSLDFLNLNQRFDQKFFQAAKSLQTLDMCSSMRYRHLKDFSKSALVVKRSPIHGRGLFTLVDLNQSQMIIEYSGEIIRNELCDKREKFYESKGIGCYMFRIDEFEVIDATTKGNQARFINHSCDPNCISKVLVIGGQKHIVIFAQRFIGRGEELTYDYKFPKEDIKIQCLCKSNKCRKYLN